MWGTDIDNGGVHIFGGINFKASDGSGNLEFYTYGGSANAIVFKPGTNEKMRITQDGKVGIQN